MNNPYEGDKVLDLFSEYAINRNNYIADLIFKYMRSEKNSPVRILEFGAGKGEFINRFSAKSGYETYAVESDESYRKLLVAHKVYSSLDNIDENFDFIFLIDVLEHIEDDIKYLKEFHSRLNENGKIFLYVPAGKKLYSSFDKKLGHFRRYNRMELISKVTDAGFTIEDCRYHEILGYFASAIHNVLLGKKMPDRFSIKIYDKILVPVTNFLEKVFKPPFGKSLYLVAKK